MSWTGRWAAVVCIGVFLSLAGPAARATGSGDRVTLTLTNGDTVEGWVLSWDDALVRLSGPDGVSVVPLSMVQTATGPDGPLEADAFRAALGPGVAAPLRTPRRLASPTAAAGLSVLWAGAGHAALGEWRAASGYAVVDGVLVGAGVWAVQARQAGALVSLIGLDLLFRGWSAAESARIARRRRAPGDPPGAPAPRP